MLPAQLYLIKLNKRPLYIIAAFFFSVVFFIFFIPDYFALKIFLTGGGLLFFALAFYFFGKAKIILAEEGLTVRYLFKQSIILKWSEIRSSALKWNLQKGHWAGLCWNIVADNQTKIRLAPAFYFKKDLQLIAELLLKRSPGIKMDNETRKMAEGVFSWYLF